MGNPRKSTAVKQLEGTFRPDREGSNEPKPEGFAECPDFLTPEARNEWTRLASQLKACGLLTAVDTAVFAAYCQAFADFRKLTEELNGMATWVWQSESGYRQVIPEVGLRKEASARLFQAAARLGLSPADRSGLHIGVGVPERKNKFADLGRRLA